MQPRQRWTLGASAFGLGGVLACYALDLPRQVAFVSMSVAFAAMLGATAFVVQRGTREQPSPSALAALVCHAVLAVSFALRAAMGLVVDESQLMPGSVSVAQLFTLAPGMVLIVVCSVCFLGMVHERHRAQGVQALAAHLQEQELLVARRTAELSSANAALTERARTITQMLARLDSLQDEERRRLARELHDTLGQLLSAMAISLAAMRARLTDAAITGHAEQLQQLLQTADSEIDRIVFILRPTALEDCGLGEAVAAYARTWSDMTGVEVDVELSGLDGDRLPAPVEAALFRVVQEALTNVSKYARARRVAVILGRRRAQLVGRIEDDGVGFDADAAMAPGAARTRWGLLGMRERIEALGGRFAIESRPGQGTTVLLRVPL